MQKRTMRAPWCEVLEGVPMNGAPRSVTDCAVRLYDPVAEFGHGRRTVCIKLCRRVTRWRQCFLALFVVEK